MPPTPDDDSAIASDIRAIGRISAVPSLLRVICDFTGMGFAAVARVTEDDWTACAVLDLIGFGLRPGDHLAVETTLCVEARAARQAIAFDHASQDAVYRDHHTPRIYRIESYVSVPILRTDGTYFGNLCAIDREPRRVSDPRTLTMFKLFADLIALQLESEDRQQAAESALASERSTAQLREQFIAVLGHDLRSPLSAIEMTGELLLQRKEQPELIRIGTRLRSATRRMARLIDDVLDFARGRMGSGIGIEVAEATDLSAALHEVLLEVRLAHPGRLLQERIEVRQPVVVDQGRLQQLLANLVNNAVTHGSADRPVEVDACIEADTFVLRVSNGGAPIAPADLARIFEPYWRPPETSHGGGLGLGLFICAQIVKEHGGSLGASSTLEAGTVFTARLPLRAASPPALHAATSLRSA
jgi:signal transduction histidine kinase